MKPDLTFHHLKSFLTLEQTISITSFAGNCLLKPFFNQVALKGHATAKCFQIFDPKNAILVILLQIVVFGLSF